MLRGEEEVAADLKSGEARGSMSFVAKAHSASCEDVEGGLRKPSGAN